MIYNEKKISEISRLGWHESVCIFVMRRVRNNGSCFSHFFERFARGLAPIRSGGVSAENNNSLSLLDKKANNNLTM